MPKLWGIDNLWDTTANLRGFRADPPSFLETLKAWEAVATISINEYAVQFRSPPPEFQTLTELLARIIHQGPLFYDLPVS